MATLKYRVLMIDDDISLSSMLVSYLRDADFDLATEPTGTLGLARLASEQFDALLLDVMLPDADGFDICRQVRVGSTIPILMLTARGDEMDRIVGLELGADDYLPKPFNPRELLARLRALLRRNAINQQDGAIGEVLRFGRLEIDLDRRAVYLDGHVTEMTAHQFDLLKLLAQNAGRVMSRDQLLEQLGTGFESFDRSIDVHVSRIRHAIEDEPRKPRRLLTVRGAGYVFARKQDE